jgi:CheY-like chemotaxis protein
VHGDPERLAQVVRNMIENAVRYTPPGGLVEVETLTAGMNAVLRVRDSGAGIDPALLPHIFEPFVQAPQSIDRATGGLGLGLAIVKRVVELHHGTVAVHSEGPGRGAEFVVTLPRAGGDADGDVASPGPTHARRSLRVLLVEDHEDARAALRSLLLADGHRVTEAADGEAGLALLAAIEPDIAFVDIGLPRLSGFELAQRVRAQGLRTPLIALTGYGLPADRAAALSAGFDEVLVKPATYEQVDAALALAAQPVTPATPIAASNS